MTGKILHILLLCLILQVDCAKILGVFHMASRSHHILGTTLLQALAAKGHQVTMISPFPSNKSGLKNYEDIELTGMKERSEELVQKMVEVQNETIFKKFPVMTKYITTINERFLNHAAIKDLIASNRKFDLVIQYWAGNEAYLGLAHYLEASTIIMTSKGSTVMTNEVTGNSAPYSYVPSMFLWFSEEMTFLQRVINTLSTAQFQILHQLKFLPAQERLRQKYFPKAPHVQELVRNVSLVLLNAHYSVESPRPHVPSMVQIGGFHVAEPKELTGELKEFMDSAVEGVVFFSLGSNVKSSSLSRDRVEDILESFSKLPLKVLWKFEADVSNLPSNVKIGKWLPQGDILAHPNLKLFVTHGGMLSITEAVYHGVPMVGIPFFGDQEANVAEGVNKAYMVKVGNQDLTGATLTNAIKEVLSNPKYRANIQLRSKQLKDQPVKPLDKAVFWIEYVLRHKGAHHLKTSALKLEWYQYYLLDVCALLFGLFLLVTALSYYIIKNLLRLSKNAFKNAWTSLSAKKIN